ncbi:sterigmatocystin biosynthesis [Fusarium albosuccineum]|uniref:Sterigmatocystin biosynthesis n=1 Tax=Fusarium albosuccineum TaxID=1237068 RepID=A0A8H4KJ81_9HYPO|nr:sterigmatocystin biosynthesis [Fusarium albosuccineum]
MESKAPWKQTVGLLALILFARIIFKWYSQRAFFRRMAKEYNLPCLPNHSWIFGDLITIGKTMAKYPPDIQGQQLPYFLMKDYPEIVDTGVIYLDVWPTAWPFCAVWHPDLAAQFTQEHPRPKHEFMRRQFRPFTGLKDLSLSEGAVWKKWRAAFNPGFAMSNIVALVPAFVQEALVWRKYLEQVAQDGETVRLEQSTMKVTCDIIVRAVLGVSIGVQTGKDTKVYPMLKKSIAQLVTDWSPASLPKLLNPLRPFTLQTSNKILSDALRDHIYDQFRNHERTEGPKTINSLAIRSYLKEKGGAYDPDSKLDPDFLSHAVENLRMFLFAGHDTTATTLCYCYYYLHRHPKALEKLLAEHEAVFPSSDVAVIAQEITSKPQLLNQIPYTTAVIKECLRLEPPVSAVRSGGPDFFLTHPVTKQRLPSEGFMLWAVSKAIQRHPTYWTDPDDFVPERWLGGEIRKNTWRPFELGPRGCIGQELALTELRMLLAMTVRDLEIIPDFDEKDPYVLGTQAYQAAVSGELTSHPKDGMPVKVKLRQKVAG